MLLHQFNRLTEGKQYHHLLLNGVCVADRFTELEDYLLFQLTDHYVEVVLIRHSDHIVSINYFRDTLALEPYLKEISIETLID